ncbi:5'-methylthioadenosine/S-adenosylhomocysteine nucleosidase family protein [Streptomyces sp. B21-083]|uniref:5'-methylthioadenosine/S-adenosylhomocysteine nucleosidase family protein n=1 Tax=Streptomyces sp. B21-083 TaxID=3039410 RepID=UPI002FF0133E
MPETKRTVAVLTALSLEYNAVRAHLTDVETLTHPRYGTKAKLGQLPDSPWQVAVINMGEGTLTAATLTERVLTWLDPEAVLLVGVAGGLKDDIGIGDVVIATKVYSIHGGKQTPDGFLVRPEAWRASHRLEQAAKEALGDTTDFQTYFKPIAVGDVVLADRKSELAEHIHTHYNDAAAIEMESSGVTQAVHLAGEAGALIIRGISDKADPNKSGDDETGSQPRAAANAAAAAVAILRELDPKPVPGQAATDPREGPFRGETYGGDHYDFRKSTFNGSFVAKFVGHRPGDEDGR